MASIDLNLLTVEEAAARAGVHRQTITRAADAGMLPEVRTSGHLRYRLFFIHELDRWAQEREKRLSESPPQAAKILARRREAQLPCNDQSAPSPTAPIP